MGQPMAEHLLRAGYPLYAYDTTPARLEPLREQGAIAAEDAAAVVREADVICLSLPSSDSCVQVAEAVILPHIATGQIVIDFGTTTPPETRRLAGLLKGKGAFWFEAPLSGGDNGAKKGKLRIFAGGDLEIFQRVQPILETVGGKETLTYCGPSGAGQVVKGVNQLAMGLGAAAYLESVAFGVRAGVAPDIIARAVGGENDRWRTMVLHMARAAQEERAENVGVKFRELPYFLREAWEAGLELPLTEALYAFCDAGPRVVVDDNRPAPSFWHELMHRQKNDARTDDTDNTNNTDNEDG